MILLCTTGHMTGGVSVQGGLCLTELSVQVGLCPGAGVSVWGVSVRETPCTVMSRWFASYWNAFLVFKILNNLARRGLKLLFE